MAATELTDGVWYPIGGFDKVRGSLQKLADEEGATTRTGAEVAAILTEPVPEHQVGKAIAGSKATQRVRGVRLASGETLEADVVVANPDLPCVWEQMMDHDAFPEAKREAERWEDAEYSCSVIEFNWCLDREVPDLLHHNVFLSGDYKGSWNRPCVPGVRRPQAAQLLLPQPRVHGQDVRARGRGLDHDPAARGEHQRAKARVREEGAPVPSEAEMVAAGRAAVLRRFREAGKDMRAPS